MSEFKAITTQEEFDAAIGDRIKRERETVAKKYEGYISKSDHEAKVLEYEKSIGDLNARISEYDKKISQHESEIAERDKKIKGYETDSVKTRIAHEVGIPFELSSRLSGDNEDEIRNDAEALKKAIDIKMPEAPLAKSDPTHLDASEAALRKTLKGLKGE